MDTHPRFLDTLSVLADGTRGRLLSVLERQELTVGEMCSVLQLPQSTVSRHLKLLVDGGWLQARKDGTRRLYDLDVAALDPTTRKLWRLTEDEIRATATSREDARRLETVLALRRSRSQEFFASAAGEWDRLRDELFGVQSYLKGMLGLLDAQWCLADLGCGTGSVAAMLAPFVDRVVAVDVSQAMLDAAAERLSGVGNVELRRADLAALPLDDASVDAATLILVLHHLPVPESAIAEARRILRPGGKLVVVDMLPHDHNEYRQEMGHVWLGFSRSQVSKMFEDCGLRLSASHEIPAESAARGPGLFSAVGVAPKAARDGRTAGSIKTGIGEHS